MTDLGIKIIELKNKGYSYSKIKKELNCSKSTISYYLGDNQKEKTKQRTEKRISNPEFILHKKIYRFRYRKITEKTIKSKVRDFQRRNGSKLLSKIEEIFSTDDFLSKIGDNPICYLSGEPINLFETNTYSIDHIIPSSKGGKNTIDNAGLTSSSINKMKSDFTVDEFLEKCIQVLTYNGYVVIKK
jgi:hypothetical protein